MIKRLKTFVLLGMTLAAVCSSEAARVSARQASAAARKWMRSVRALDGRMNAEVESVSNVETADGVTFRIVRMKGGGYVVMGADTTMAPVIAYSSTGVLREDLSNPLWSLLKGDFAARARAMRSRRRSLAPVQRRKGRVRLPEERWATLLASDDEESATSARKTLLSVAHPPSPVEDIRVDSFVKSVWAQNDYRNWGWTNETDYCYNYYTPDHFPCGCVATVGGQLMRYHEYPTQEVVAATYPCSSRGVGVDLTMIGGGYAWSDMPLVPAEFADGCPEKFRQAIGKLTYDVGVSCRTAYGAGGSSSPVNLLAKRLVDRFGYANAEIIVFNDGEIYDFGYSLDRLKAAVIPNLNARLPVILGISGEGAGGHVVLGDGYGYSDGDFFLHLNLGWADVDGSNAWYMPPEIDDYDTIESVTYNIWPSSPAGGVLVGGRVLDLQGNVVAGARVTATNTDDGQQAEPMTTDANGLYALLVVPGNYSIRVDNGIAQAQTNVVVAPCVSTDVRDDGAYTSRSLPAIGNLQDVDFVVNASLWQTTENPDGSVTVVGVSETVSGVVEVPDKVNGKTVSSLADGVFDGRGDIERIILPATVAEIGSRAFVGCTGLTALVTTANPAYRSTEDGLLYDLKKSALVCCPAGHVGEVLLPEELLEIGDDAFGNCRNVTNLTVPVGVTSIGTRAFVGSGIRSMTLPSSLMTVGAGAFAGLGSVLETVWLEAGEAARIRPLLVNAGLEGSKTEFVEIYEVNFDMGGRGSRSGGGEMFQRVPQGRAAELPLVAAPTGWKFLGWFTATEGGTSAEGLPVTSNLTYRAQWKANEYTLVYAPGGAEGKPHEVVLTYDAPYELAENPFAKPGSYFGGWTDEGGTLHRPGEVVSNLTDEDGGLVTYTATWYESPLDFAVGGPGLKWETDGGHPWEITSDRPRTGEECLRSSPNLEWGQTSWLKTTVRGPSELRFRYRKVQYPYPFVVTLDGEEVLRDETSSDKYLLDWVLEELSVPEGEHEIVFSFTLWNEEEELDEKFNGVWLDDVEVGQYARLPTFSPETSDVEASACLFTNSLAVTISSDLGATVYYTTDGTEPTKKSTVYKEPLVLTKTTLVKAMATVPGKNPSAVATALYVEDGPVEPGVWTTNAGAVRRAGETHGNLIAVVMADAGEDASSAFWKVAENAEFTNWAREHGVYLVSADKSRHPYAQGAHDWFYDWFYSDKGPEELYLPAVAFFNAWEPDVPVGGGEFWKGATVNGIKYSATVASLESCFASFLTERPLPDRDCVLALSGKGWHEVSFNALPLNATPASVFAGAEGVGEVRRDGKSWTPGKGGTLERLEIGKGYWVQTRNETVTVSTFGAVDPDVSVDLQAGWNLVGYPLFAEGALESVLPTQNVRYVYSRGRVYPNGRLMTMAPGNGYWISAVKGGALAFRHQDGMPTLLPEATGAPQALLAEQAFDPVPPTIFARMRLTFEDNEAPAGAGVVVYRRSDNRLCGYGEVAENGELTFGMQVVEGSDVYFKGWRRAGATNEELVVVAGGEVYRDVDYAMPAPGKVLEGLWLMDRASAEAAKPLVVTFDGNGGEPKTQTAGLLVGDPFRPGKQGFPTPPTWTGHSFAGWYTAKAGGERVGDGQEILLTDPAVKTLYAQWGAPRVVFELDGEYPSGTTAIEPLTVRVDGFSQSSITVSGLPAGMKFTAKTTKVNGIEVPANSVYGFPTKDGAYAVTVKATATEPKNAKAEASYVVMVDKSDMTRVKIAAHDVADVLSGLKISSRGGEFDLTGEAPEAELDLVQGIYYSWLLDAVVPFGLKATAVKVSGLPSGLKFTAKPENMIAGVPNKTSKAGTGAAAGTLVPSTVKVTVTTEGKVSREFALKMTVRPASNGAVGTFYGTVVGKNGLACGTLTLTAKEDGKISAKVVNAAGSHSFSATGWKETEPGVLKAEMTTKGERLTVTFRRDASWNESQLVGTYASGKGGALPDEAQRNAFEKTWLFAAAGNEANGWTLSYTNDAKAAALTVTLKPDGKTSLSGALPGKSGKLKVTASGYVNVGAMKSGAFAADFVSFVTAGGAKRAVSVRTNLWFDRKDGHPEGTGGASL